MTIFKKNFFRKLHSQFAIIMMLPLLITLVTGSLFQIAYLTSDNLDNYMWLLDLHRGSFGVVNLENIYPLLNAFGLLMLLITGVTMWLQSRFKHRKITNPEKD